MDQILYKRRVSGIKHVCLIRIKSEKYCLASYFEKKILITRVIIFNDSNAISTLVAKCAVLDVAGRSELLDGQALVFVPVVNVTKSAVNGVPIIKLIDAVL